MSEIRNWTVDYGDAAGPRAVEIPHAWRQDVPVSWEGPAIYRAEIDLTSDEAWLLFEGVSYQAKVRINGVEAGTHQGIWDAFSVPMMGLKGKVALEVEVIKNGGESFPVRDVLSGFLPFVYHTFGGIHRQVTIIHSKNDPTTPRDGAVPRISVRGSKLYVDAKPFYMRGVLSWGWYPDVGHTNPPDEVIRNEIKLAKNLGFNLVKFCLWVPTHRHLELLRQEGMFAWIELPLWDPSPDRLDSMEAELERIVVQYRKHDNILVWTVGCELGPNAPAEFRERMYRKIKELTDSPLVTDNSGSCEMYGGDLREFGDFYDFHPYCDLPFYPQVLDSLLPRGRTLKPILLGEFNDIDSHRDLPKYEVAQPYWASPEDALNAQGARWQHDLPRVVSQNRFSALEPSHERLLASSKDKSLFIRKTVQEWVRLRDEVGGYVITGWRDTPISSAGFMDNWDQPRFSREEVIHWNGPSVLYLAASRRPPWIAGGNRPGWIDPHNHFLGPVHLRVGVHAETSLSGRLEWDVLQFSWHRDRRPRGRVASGHTELLEVDPLRATELGEIAWEPADTGGYFLRVSFCGVTNSWPIWITDKPDFASLPPWVRYDPANLLPELPQGDGDHLVATRIPSDFVARLESGAKILLFLLDEGTLERPFWRECAFEFLEKGFWTSLGLGQNWERFLPISTDRVIDPAWLSDILGEANVQVLMNRVDVRTYEDAPIMVRGRLGTGEFLITTLRPFGGLGIAPIGLGRNPAGAFLLEGLLNFRT